MPLPLPGTIMVHKRGKSLGIVGDDGNLWTHNMTLSPRGFRRFYSAAYEDLTAEQRHKLHRVQKRLGINISGTVEDRLTNAHRELLTVLDTCPFSTVRCHYLANRLECSYGTIHGRLRQLEDLGVLQRFIADDGCHVRWGRTTATRGDSP